jgi:hypothetical protein
MTVPAKISAARGPGLTAWGTWRARALPLIQIIKQSP